MLDGYERPDFLILFLSSCLSLLTYTLLVFAYYLCILSWARERYVHESKLTQGTLSLGSMRGVSGHTHNPFAGVRVLCK